MSIHVSNSLTRKKQEFKPINKNTASMYVCGPTVYGPSHIGHARTYIAFDVIRRYLQYSGLKVDFVCNITDVHDDMIKKANELNITIFELADTNLKQYLKDMDSLNVKSADHYPRVTEYISEIIDLVQTLEEKGFAYATEDGSVYFDVNKFKNYGQLSGIKVEQSKTGTRVETDKYDKENIQDFALWKGAKPNEPNWDSPWGPGRPGWHIECSAMSQKLLGQTIDIHAGAIDLIFPHHENEIAQSVAATGKPFVNYWLHSGLLRIEGEKMSKSLGNFIEIPDLLNKYDPMAVRLYLLQSHYKSSLNFTYEGLDEANRRLSRWKRSLDYDQVIDPAKIDPNFSRQFQEVMDDDFNTPQAMALLEEILKSDLSDQAKFNTVLSIDQVLGLNLKQPDTEQIDTQTRNEIQYLIEQREQARTSKDFSQADQIREELKKKFNVEIEDTPAGTKWHVCS